MKWKVKKKTNFEFQGLSECFIEFVRNSEFSYSYGSGLIFFLVRGTGILDKCLRDGRGRRWQRTEISGRSRTRWRWATECRVAVINGTWRWRRRKWLDFVTITSRISTVGLVAYVGATRRRRWRLIYTSVVSVRTITGRVAAWTSRGICCCRWTRWWV